MEQQPTPISEPRSIWMRGLLMILMAIAYQLSGTLLCLVAVAQFLFTLFGGHPNQHLADFGRSLGRYFQQNVNFLSFASEDLPFPFSAWPSA